MADRIPLIINSTAEQIQELPSGDNLIGINQITAGGAIVSGGGITAVQPMVLLADVVDYTMTSSSSNGVPIEFGGLVTNVGCTLSNSNSRVTVPTAGTYLITGGIGGTRTNGTSSPDSLALAIMKNGSVFPSNASFPKANTAISVNQKFNFYVSMPLVLAANDYIELTQIELNVGGSTATVDTGYFSVTRLH